MSAGAVASASLPDDTLVEILSRVPFKSLCRCKCVSKAWRDLITDPLNRKKLPQTLEGFFLVFGGWVDYSDSDDGGGEDIGSDGGSANSDSDDGDGEDSGTDRGSKNYGEDSSSDGDSHNANGDGEDRSSDGGGDNSDNDDADGEDSSSDGGDSNNLRRQAFVHFVDVLGRPPHPVDHCFPFLTELPGILNIYVTDDCNGLLLFGCFQAGKSPSKSYIVSNPATEQWVVVPNPDNDMKWLSFAYLVFDPAASSHFHLVRIRVDMVPVHIYSSKSGVWSPVSDWGDLSMALGLDMAYANGMLYAVLSEGDRIAVMDVEGNTRKVIPVPFQEANEFRPCTDYVGQSQGRLHLIYHADLCHDEIFPEQQNNELFIWVLEDYDTEEWILKDTVSFLKLFGQITGQTINGFEVVAIHPDQNLVFLIHHFNWELISYNMDNKEVCNLCTLGTGYRSITPYVPYFRELSTLENKH